jgi:hypothetical protein
VARANSNIEIWFKDTWSQVLTIPGNANAQPRNIHWLEKKGSQDSNLLYSGSKKRRLITTGLNGHVLEWNLLNGTIRSKFNATAAIWNS